MTAPAHDCRPAARLDETAPAHREAGRGLPVVLVHGLACGWRMWRRQMRTLAPRARIIAYDLRGHGTASAPTRGCSEDILAEDLAGLIDRCGGRAVVVGFSLGGGVALNLAGRCPERVAGLVLAATGSGSDAVEAARARALEWAAAARADGIDAFAQRMLGSAFAEDYLRAGGARAHRHMRLLIGRHPPAGLADILAGVQARRRSVYARQAMLRRLAMPVLVICGTRDASCRRSSAFLADQIPNAELRWLHGIGHMASLEAPATFDAALLGFIDRHFIDRHPIDRSSAPWQDAGAGHGLGHTDFKHNHPTTKEAINAA
jgi:pimeloyl-ACP methyl ester carboxylesterase